MSDVPFFFPPNEAGYSETLTLRRYMHEFDDGHHVHYPLQDDGNLITEWPTYSITASFTRVSVQDSSTLEQLLIKGERDEIWFPLWWSKMQLDGAHSSGAASFTLKDDTGLNSKVDHTEFYGSRWGFTNAPRSNVRLFVCKKSDPYFWELLSISSCTSPDTVVTTTNRTKTFSDEDWAVPAVKCKLSGGASYSNRTGFLTDLSVTAREI